MNLLEELYPTVIDKNGNIVKPMKRGQNELQQRAFRKGMRHILNSLEKLHTKSEAAIAAGLYATRATNNFGIDKEIIETIYLDAYQETIKKLSE